MLISHRLDFVSFILDKFQTSVSAERVSLPNTNTNILIRVQRCFRTSIKGFDIKWRYIIWHWCYRFGISLIANCKFLHRSSFEQTVKFHKNATKVIFSVNAIAKSVNCYKPRKYNGILIYISMIYHNLQINVRNNFLHFFSFKLKNPVTIIFLN